ncbi:MAG: DUF1801 domain-containing protein [Flavobacteriales bacterium]
MKKIANTADYLKALPQDQRAALEKVRSQILSAAPGAVEHFGYGLPGFKLDGHPLIYIGAAKNHCALYGSVPQGFADKLKNYEVSKGTIRFAADKPLPATLVKAIVKAKAVENQLRWPVKKPMKKSTK